MAESPDHASLARSAREESLIRRHRAFWGDAYARRTTLFSMIVFAASLGAEYVTTAYATASASNPVTDLILSNTPIFDVNAIYVYGLLLLVAFVTLLVLANPRRIPFTLYSLGVFILIRSFFVSLTHLAPYPIPTSPDFGTTMIKIFFGGDLFFSGHTGAPFLMALVYWDKSVLRYLFLAWSVFFAVVVLLGHLHYSIDVAAAYFITYSIYVLCERLFPRARRLFIADPTPRI